MATSSGLSQKDQTKHNTLLHLGTQSVKRRSFSAKAPQLLCYLEGHSNFYFVCRKVYASFAEVFGSDVPSTSKTPKPSTSTAFETNSTKGKINTNSNEITIEFSFDTPLLKSVPPASKTNTAGLSADKSQAAAELSPRQQLPRMSNPGPSKELTLTFPNPGPSKEWTSPTLSQQGLKGLIPGSPSITKSSTALRNTAKRKSDVVDSPVNVKSSKLLDDFKDLDDQIFEDWDFPSSHKDVVESENTTNSTLSNSSTTTSTLSNSSTVKKFDDDKFKLNTLMQSRSSLNNSIHERRKVQNKVM